MEERVISGRHLPYIDPELHLWHWPIPVYLFLGGLAAGIMIFAAWFTIRGKAESMPSAVKWSTFLVPGTLVLGLGLLFLDLHHKMYVWRLYTTIRLESPMSWGAWTLLIVTPLSFVWSAGYLRELAPGLAILKWEWFKKFETWINLNRVKLAWPMLLLALALGIYTGILLSAFNARPLWNTAILGPLFLASGMSAGADIIMYGSKDKNESKIMGRISLAIIAIEIFLIIHMFMGLLAGPEVQVAAANLFLGGEFTLIFWGFVVGCGLLVPALLISLKLRGYNIPGWICAGLILLGGLTLRIVMVQAGQISAFI